MKIIIAIALFIFLAGIGLALFDVVGIIAGIAIAGVATLIMFRTAKHAGNSSSSSSGG